jgi:hypothetical protein
MKNAPKKLGIKGSYLIKIKTAHEKPIANIIPNGENQNCFF